MKLMFWIALGLTVYAYFGYPLLLLVLGRFKRRDLPAETLDLPAVSIIIPAYNEEKIIQKKIENTLALVYPGAQKEIIVISDASEDRTDAIVTQHFADQVIFLVQPERQGKAAALNRGLEQASGDVVVFTDASILLAPSALKAVVAPFEDPAIGCVSGEDHVHGAGGEGAYGKYELTLRNLESQVASIVGASGCFYAQRRSLCIPFKAGMAPDFLSVLETVQQGYRAVTQPRAMGLMGRVKSSGQEFTRKLRTLLRGMTTLMAYKHLLNPRRAGFFAVALWSHKILRWSVGGGLVAMLFANLFLLDEFFYLVLFVMQTGFYLLAIVGWWQEQKGRAGIAVKIPLFFCLVNIAGLIAWGKYLMGVRQELWESSKR